MRYKIANTEIAVPLASFNLHGTKSRAFATSVLTLLSTITFMFLYTVRIFGSSRVENALWVSRLNKTYVFAWYIPPYIQRIMSMSM